jgi:valyl-tRNA synthetase
MSKSLGNGIDPLEVVNLYGADALRYTVVAGSGLGTDVYMDPNNLETTFSVGRNFANKVWNAGRFALMNIQAPEVKSVADVQSSLELADRWILSRLDAATEEVTRHLDSFRFHEAAAAGYHFFWGELADWYLELLKPRLQGDVGQGSREAAEATLVAALDGILRLLHPVMPFITDALWRRLPRVAGETAAASIMIASWPRSGVRRDEEAEAQMTALMELIGEVRTLRAEYNVAPGTPIAIHLHDVHETLDNALRAEGRALQRMARVGSVERNAQTVAGAAGAHAVLRGGAELFIPLADIIDLAQERDRLQKELDRLSAMLKGTEAKLSNEQFTARAPADVIEREREKADNFRDQRDRLSSKLAALRV